MGRWWDHRCKLPAHGFALGHCEGLLFRISDTGDLEIKCHRCRRIQVVGREVLDGYRLTQLVST